MHTCSSLALINTVRWYMPSEAGGSDNRCSYQPSRVVNHSVITFKLWGVSGTDDTEERMEIVELENHPYYVATQFHPEYLSRPLKPSPPFLGLILASVGRLQTFFSRGCKLSPRESDDSDYIDSGQLVIAFVLTNFTTLKKHFNFCMMK